MKTIQRSLKDIVLEHSPRESDTITINSNTNLIDDLLLDSMQLILLITALEDSFSIEINDFELDINVISIYGSLENMILEKINNKI